MKFIQLLAFVLCAAVLFTGTASAAAAEASPDKTWTVRCDKETKKDEPKRARCEIFQRLIMKKTNQRFVEVAIGFPKDKKTARGIIIAPLGIMLQSGIKMQVDDGQVYKFQVRYCDNGGCYGYVDLNDQLLASMRKGSKLKISFQALSQKNLKVDVELKGIEAALKEIS